MKPLYKKIANEDHYYIYDNSTNRIFKTDQITFSIIDDFFLLPYDDLVRKWVGDFSKERIQSAIDQLNLVINQKKILSTQRPRQMRHALSPEELINLIDHKLTQLVLEVTENCNLRCHYCLYSGKFRYKRCHSNKNMNLSTAFKAIDYYIHHSDESENRVISFYGGEPLMNLGVIEKSIEYAKSKIKRGLSFAMTSNGTMLNDELIQFFHDNNCSLNISLDGPRDIHDKYRVSRSGGKTYDSVMANINKIKSDILGITCTLMSYKGIERVKHFFDELCKHRKLSLIVAFADCQDSEIEIDASKADVYMSILRNEYIDNIINQEPDKSPFLSALFQNSLLEVKKRFAIDGHGIYINPNGICIPGQRKLFVSATGNFFVCEKMIDSIRIGDVDSGINHDAVIGLIDDYIAISSDNCLSCWGNRLCGFCFLVAKKGNVMDAERKEMRCKNYLCDLESFLQNYVTILEKNPKALDFIDNIVIS